MKEMTDRELTDKISQVFDNFEDPTAGYGWQELRKKHPGSEKKPVLLWWAAAAAVFVVLCGLWFIVPDTNDNDQAIAEKKSQTKTNNGHISANNDESANSKGNKTDNSVSRTAKNSATAGHVSQSKPSSISAGGIKVIEYSRKIAAHRPILPAEPLSKPEAFDIAITGEQIILTAQNNRVLNGGPAIPGSSKPVQNHETSRDSTIDAVAGMPVLANQNHSVDNHVHTVKEVPYNSRKSNTKNHTFSVFAGSYFNYSLGSETKLNFGAGFTSDIRITSNVSLSTGMALAKNTLTYNDGVPSARTAKRAYDAIPSFGLTNNLVGNNLTTVTKYHASLLSLDIPVNVKYLIIPQGNKLYLLAGLSSGTYLSERYSSDYRNYSPAGTFIKSQGVEVKSQFQSFDLARTLNISFGYSANLGKSHNITVEPFLKYPLGGLGSENLKFGSTGVNLKLNFSKFK